jgi:KUP system potassium uptake protein
VTEFVKGAIFKIDFNVGFRIETQVNLLFRQVLNDLNRTNEVKLESGYPSLKKFHIPGDCRYVIIDRILTEEHKFNAKERLIMNLSDIMKILAIPQAKYMHLDASNILIEKVPLGKSDKLPKKLTRVSHLRT